MFTGILFKDGQIKGDRSGFKLDFFFQIIRSYKSDSYMFDVLTKKQYACIINFTKQNIVRQCFNNLIHINDVELNNCLTIQRIHY